MRFAQRRTLENDCYMFRGAEELGLSCEGCRHYTYCQSLGETQ